MRRDPRAYLVDVVSACDAILDATREIGLQTYLTSRLIRSSVEREFMIVGEALGALLRLEPGLAKEVPEARRIIAFRHRLAHEYAVVDDALVWAIASRDVEPLRQRVTELLERIGTTRES